MGVVATRASRHRGAHHPGGERRGEREERRQLREAHPTSFRCFSRHMQTSVITPLQLKIKMSLGRELQHKPATSRVHAATIHGRLQFSG